jgi:hypothetical protein
MRLPPLDPLLHLEWTWAEHHPGEEVPTLAEYALQAGFTETQARRWLVKCAAFQRKITRMYLHGLRMPLDLPVQVTGESEGDPALLIDFKKASAKIAWLKRMPDSYWPQLDRGQ